MDVTELEDENGYRCLSIEVPWFEIAADYQDLLTRYATEARLPGFRPGKAPQSVIEQRFGREIIGTLGARVVERLGRKVIGKFGIESIGPLEASELTCEKDRSFHAVVRYLPMPEFRLPEISDLITAEDGTDPRDWLSKRLLELVLFEVPAGLVRQELDREELGKSDPGSEAWQTAADRIRLILILKKIARQEGIEVHGNDVNRRITEKAEEFGQSEKSLRAELEKGDGLSRLRDLLLAESTLAYLIEKTRERHASNND